ncbi:alpha/beta fold hydrolase [Sphingomonas sp. ID1715]|nr:alpha/beta fold hydrolase [Sphingomonas sp. ID1715]
MTFRDTCKSRAIALIALPPAYSRRIRTTVSKINIPISPPENPAGCLNHRNEGSLLDADHPANGVLFARRSTAATFNLLRGRDLIWNYVVNNYLLGNDYPQFDLLHWNGDTTNLPAKWHRAYLTDLYRDNKLVVPKAMTVLGQPLDLRDVKTPTYVQAGREDHIAPAESVWKITDHFTGPVRFVLAGSGHIAGVVNPPSAGKYQYWTNESGAKSLEEFVAGATETKGSWWPDWIKWINERAPAKIKAEGARVPGAGSLPSLDDAPGSYVRTR